MISTQATLDDAAHFVHFTGRYGCGAAESAGCVLYETLRASPAVTRLEAVLKTLPPLPIPAQAPVSPVTPRPTPSRATGPWTPDEVKRFDAAFKRFYDDGLPDWSGRVSSYVGTRDKYQVQTFKRARVKPKDPYYTSTRPTRGRSRGIKGMLVSYSPLAPGFAGAARRARVSDCTVKVLALTSIGVAAALRVIHKLCASLGA